MAGSHQRGLHLAVALEGAGSHPGSWRAPGAQPRALTTAAYWRDAVAEAEAGLVDLVTIADGFSLHDGAPRTDRAAGRLDSVLVASRIAPTTRRVGLLPTSTLTHSEPFHVSKAIATLDYVSGGRAGVVLRSTADPDEAALFGRRRFADDPGVLADLVAEAADFATVLRLLWDSWEDDAEIRDAATGRFVDRDKLHYIDFEGRFFSVRGPSITPRPPQGQPIIAAPAAHVGDLSLIGRVADIGFLTPRDVDDAARAVSAIAEAHTAAGRDADDPALVFVDLFVVLGDSEEAAAQRLSQLDEWAGWSGASGTVFDGPIFTGTADGLADEIERWTSVDGVRGVRLHPASLAEDLRVITREVVPVLQRRGRFRTEYPAGTLRDRLGLSRPQNRFTENSRSTNSEAGVA